MGRIKNLYTRIQQKGIVLNVGGKTYKYNVKEATKRQIPDTVARGDSNPFSMLSDYKVGEKNYSIYESLREIPMFDRAIELSKGLVGDWNPETTNAKEEKIINDFRENVTVGYRQKSYLQFRRQFIDALLLYGTAFVEIVPSILDDEIQSVHVISPKSFGFKKVNDEYLYAYKDGINLKVVENQDLITYQAHKQKLGSFFGESVYNALPFVGQVITRALNSFDTRYWRESNPTYFFSIESDKEIQMEEADMNFLISSLKSSVQSVMQLKKMGQTGDIYAPLPSGSKLVIKAIGADGKEFKDEIPIKTVLEQASSGLGYPLFMLNIHSESSAYKLTTHQAELITTMIKQFRKLVEQTDRYIINMHLTMNRIQPTYSITWDDVNLSDEVEKARAELLRAQAKKAIAETVKLLTESGLMQDTESISEFMIENNLIKLNKDYNKDRLMSEIKTFLFLKESDKINEYYKELE